MKTMQELYDEVMASQELKAQFVEAVRAGKQEAFLKEHGCGATMEEVAAFLKTKVQGDTPLSVNELKDSAGGTCNENTNRELFTSIFTVLGFGCLTMAIASHYGYQGRHVGQQHDEDGRLCNR